MSYIVKIEAEYEFDAKDDRDKAKDDFKVWDKKAKKEKAKRGRIITLRKVPTTGFSYELETQEDLG